MRFIYSLHCPITGDLRYVGKTDDPYQRLKSHISKARGQHLTHHCARWIKRLLDAGVKPTMKIMCVLPDESHWQGVEKMMIASARWIGCDITNTTAGGDGVVGLTQEAIYKRVVSRHATLEGNPSIRERALNRFLTTISAEEWKTKQSSVMKAVWERPGYKERHQQSMSREGVKVKLSMAAEQRWKNPAMKEKMKQAISSALANPNVRAQMSASQIESWGDSNIRERRVASIRDAAKRPETKEKVAVSNREIASRPQTIALRSEILKAKWADPVFRERQTAALQLAKGKISTAAKAQWADPEKAAKCRAALKAAWADPAKKERAMASRKALWSDPVKRAEMIERQKLVWVARKAAKEAA